MSKRFFSIPGPSLFRILELFGLNETGVGEDEEYLIMLLQMDCRYDKYILIRLVII